MDPNLNPNSSAEGGCSSSSSSVSVSVIKEGRLSGRVPECESFAVHYPGYPSSTSRAIQTLGGLSHIAKVRNSESGVMPMELRFRPEDPFCHPLFGDLHPATGLLLKISKKQKQQQEPSAQIVTRVNHAYHFEGMADYQHVIPLHAANSKRKKRTWDPQDSSSDPARIAPDMDAADVMMLVPPLFSSKNKPENIVLKPAPIVVSKNMQRGVVVDRWEMDIGPSLAISFKNPEQVPGKVNWEDKISKGTTEWDSQEAICKLFDEKPIWPRRSICEQLADNGYNVSDNLLKRLLFRAGYYFSTGPFGKFWIRRGYDPRKDQESRIYQRIDFRIPPELRNLSDMDPDFRSKKQRWKDICNFVEVPFKVFVFFQLSELQDDFIQDEIHKPSYQTTCSHATGWFSQPMVKIMRLQVSIRFLSLFPVEPTRDLLKLAKSQLERSKKEEAIWRSQKCQVDDHISKTAADLSTKAPCVQPDQEEVDREEEEEEEEEEEDDDGGFHADDNSYEMEGLPNNYFQEILRGLSFENGQGSTSIPDSEVAADLSDGEYQIYEQPSNDNDES